MIYTYLVTVVDLVAEAEIGRDDGGPRSMLVDHTDVPHFLRVWVNEQPNEIFHVRRRARPLKKGYTKAVQEMYRAYLDALETLINDVQYNGCECIGLISRPCMSVTIHCRGNDLHVNSDDLVNVVLTEAD